jgi:hypothetical protein
VHEPGSAMRPLTFGMTKNALPFIAVLSVAGH